MEKKRKVGTGKALRAPPVHRAILEPEVSKDDDIKIFNVRFGTVTIKKNRKGENPPQAERQV